MFFFFQQLDYDCSTLSSFSFSFGNGINGKAIRDKQRASSSNPANLVTTNDSEQIVTCSGQNSKNGFNITATRQNLFKNKALPTPNNNCCNHKYSTKTCSNCEINCKSKNCKLNFLIVTRTSFSRNLN